ncbi:MAG: hypothetical protein AUG51_19330 [Acidobacteria bacterium 13_1_20CM_3_53_8]|nr:MAG: hypothetical protein AUG51_19330 [Acidobacteria bacterium 13_1_20CM_3_53_8]
MAQETLQVASISTPDSWTLGAGASKVVAVNTPDDDDTSYINSGATSGTTEQFNVTDSSAIGASATINFVRIVARTKKGGSQTSTYVVSVVLSGNATDGASQTSGNSSYSTTQDDFATRPSVGGAWTLADVNALQIKIRNTQARDLRCTSFYVIVDYTPATGIVAAQRGPMRGLLRGVLRG